MSSTSQHAGDERHTGFHVNPFVHITIQSAVAGKFALWVSVHLSSSTGVYANYTFMASCVCVCVCEHIHTYVMGHCVRNRPPVSEISEQYLTLGLSLLRPPFLYFIFCERQPGSITGLSVYLLKTLENVNLKMPTVKKNVKTNHVK